jgi:hypothetical protein
MPPMRRPLLRTRRGLLVVGTTIGVFVALVTVWSVRAVPSPNSPTNVAAATPYVPVGSPSPEPTPESPSPSPSPIESPTPSPPSGMKFDCWTSDYQSTYYHALAEVWASGIDFELCKVEFDSGYALSAVEQQAVASVSEDGRGTTPQDTLADLYVDCALAGPKLVVETALRYFADSQLPGSLVLCPNAPQVAIMRALAQHRMIDDGKYSVGEDMAPGTWFLPGPVSDCYWERSGRNGDIVANNFVTNAPKGVTVTVRAGEGFTSDGCGVWTHK